MQPYTAAIVGTGGISQAHARGLKESEERVHLVACCDLDEERLNNFADEWNVEARYQDFDKMLAEVKPDLVHICTPPWLHTELSVKALRAGAWVLCEKPLCGSLAEFDLITQAENDSGNYCSSVFQYRFGSGGQHLKKLIDQGALGRPLVGQCHTTWYRDDDYFAVPWRGKWSTELGGPTVGHGIHSMDLFLWLMGDWTEVQAVTATLDRHIEVEDVSMAIVQFENGALGSIINSVLSPEQKTFTRFDFQKATVELLHLYYYTNENWTYYKAPHISDDELERWSQIPENRASSHGSQIRALLDSMDKGERPLVSGKESRRILEFISSIYKAADTKAPVARGSIQPGDPYYNALSGREEAAKGA